MTKAQLKKEEIQEKTIEKTTSANVPVEHKEGKERRSDFAQRTTSPFTLMRHIAEDMENMMFPDFELRSRFGFPSLRSPFFANDLFKPSFSAFDNFPFSGVNEGFLNNWSPDVEMFEREGNLIVQADLPGMKKDDIKVEINENLLTIEGERKEDREERGEGFYRSERTYGSFCRQIPLPEGVKTENAKAEFKNGVLEVSMAAPQLTSVGKRLEITEGETGKAASGK